MAEAEEKVKELTWEEMTDEQRAEVNRELDEATSGYVGLLAVIEEAELAVDENIMRVREQESGIEEERTAIRAMRVSKERIERRRALLGVIKALDETWKAVMTSRRSSSENSSALAKQRARLEEVRRKAGM